MIREKRPTLADLVKKTGFSQGAISRAFNGNGGISDATCKKILKAAREIGYHPNPSARNFKRGYSGRVGIILPNLQNANYSEIYEHLDTVMSSGGTATSLALTHYCAEREADTILHWSAGETDALVINPIPKGVNLDLYRKLKSWGYPLLFIYLSFGNEFDCLTVDYNQSLRQALSYLKDVGHKKVAYVGFVPPAAVAYGKHGTLVKALEDVGLAFDEELSVMHASGAEAGRASFEQWQTLGRRPTAVVAFNDETAASIYCEARYLGLQIPKDLSLLGGDDVRDAELIGLSTIRNDRREMASKIFSMLKNRMRDFDSPIQRQSLRSELVMRQSLGPPSKD
ncbi:LacI family DNA-binding transcriptional regulator [Rubellicoccus peritrichatus]|uniref:LacI family DNA-binding transcriptional regulator n=1 Tax=Rubellicoccus peritrichatus TaxID=3080537 RepID=A0AAQ3QR40_9BACT|nr:LacI family DNA-binding transcriptional regulator [Puniceicoccus sp. CR14]WOO40928.1 LacI family DNA-binding transcriptional regulator [Puniceicoccus sp. CR14]